MWIGGLTFLFVLCVGCSKRSAETTPSVTSEVQAIGDAVYVQPAVQGANTMATAQAAAARANTVDQKEEQQLNSVDNQ